MEEEMLTQKRGNSCSESNAATNKITPKGDTPKAKPKFASLSQRANAPLITWKTYVFTSLIFTSGVLGFFLKDLFIDESVLERYEISIQQITNEVKFDAAFGFSLLRFFQIAFYDVLIIVYLFKPIKILTSEEKNRLAALREQQFESGKQVRPIMEKLQKQKNPQKPDLTQDEQQLFRTYYETNTNIEKIVSPKKK